MAWRNKLLEKINSLPEEQRIQALKDLEVHNYCAANENKHTKLIKDVPHPLMTLDGDRYSRSGAWYMGGMGG